MQTTTGSTVPADLGFTVQRGWSNAAARTGHDPCVPTVNAPFFTTYPKDYEAIAVTDRFGRHITTRGFKVGVGESKTIDLTLYSDADVGKWSINVADLTWRSKAPEEFTYALSKTTGTAGDTVQLTITGVRPATTGQGFVIESRTPTDAKLFPVWVTN